MMTLRTLHRPSAGITAKHRGTCHTCSLPIQPGAKITGRRGAFSHLDCAAVFLEATG